MGNPKAPFDTVLFSSGSEAEMLKYLVQTLYLRFAEKIVLFSSEKIQKAYTY